jgi:hypothetical protein
MYAHVTAGTVDSVGNPPQLVYQDDRWWDLRSRDLPTLALVGWFPVTESPKPADTAATKWTPVFTPNGATVVQSWVEVPKTAEEIAAEEAAAALTATRAAVKLIITDLQAEKTRCDVVIAKANNTVTGADTKDVARAAKRIADAAIDLARLVTA